MVDEVEDELEDLLGEIMVIAAGLRQPAEMGHASPGLSLPARSVLKLLGTHSGLTVPQLSRQRGTSRQNIQVLVDRLEGAGLVEYVANPDHQRSERVRLTEAGKRSLASANQRQASWQSGLLTQVTEEELRSCCALLGRIRGALAGGKPAPHPIGTSSRKYRKRVKNPAPAPGAGTRVGFSQDSPSEVSPPETLLVSLL